MVWLPTVAVQRTRAVSSWGLSWPQRGGRQAVSSAEQALCVPRQAVVLEEYAFAKRVVRGVQAWVRWLAWVAQQLACETGREVAQVAQCHLPLQATVQGRVLQSLQLHWRQFPD